MILTWKTIINAIAKQMPEGLTYDKAVERRATRNPRLRRCEVLAVLGPICGQLKRLTNRIDKLSERKPQPEVEVLRLTELYDRLVVRKNNWQKLYDQIVSTPPRSSADYSVTETEPGTVTIGSQYITGDCPIVMGDTVVVTGGTKYSRTYVTNVYRKRGYKVGD